MRLALLLLVAVVVHLISSARRKTDPRSSSLALPPRRHRVILDEAHNIKDRQANTAKAAFALQAHYRWCLSGTPLQNRVGELYSLIRFVGASPYANYFCKRCDCSSLHWLCNKGSCSVRPPLILVVAVVRPR